MPLSSPSISETGRLIAPSALSPTNGVLLRQAALVFALALAMHLPWLKFTPLAGTEGHRALPAHQMVTSGWWMAPLLYGKPYLAKPPFHYWLIALAESIAGRANEFVWRLPSAVNGALLCAAGCWFGGRWFGKTAGIVAGLCAAGMVTLWGQSQVTDIDSTDVLASALAGFCGIELLIAGPARPWPWVVAAGLAFGAGLMTKGPSALPMVLAVWIWASVLALREKRMRLFGSIGFWLPLLIGIAAFGAYVYAAYRSLALHGMPVDFRGVKEGTDRLHAGSWRLLGKSLMVMPISLFAYAIPVSLALPFSFDREVRRGMTAEQRRIMSALAGVVLLGWCACVAVALDNPRYGYTTLPPLCPLAGAVAVGAAKNPRTAHWLRVIVAFAAGALAVLSIAMSYAAWALPDFRILLAACPLLATLTSIWMGRRLNSCWRCAWAFVPLLFLAVIPFSLQRHLARSQASGIRIAPLLRRIVGNDDAVACSGAVTSKPEIFYYAGTRVDFYPYDFLPRLVPPNRWVILDQLERKQWLKQRGIRLDKEMLLFRNGSTDHFIAWYSKDAAAAHPE